jgi:hypothetical protein
MNGTKRLAGRVGLVLCAALFTALTWHTAYAAEISVGVAIHTESDFYEPLGSYGRWEVVGSYGRCWIPGGVEAGWSPYCNGYWQQTDAGWYWASDEPWGWATYHYGRWDLDPQFGWYWVPQTQWAPAWVSWREGGGYIGWCPMGPSGRGVVEVEVAGHASRGFVFVEERRFLEPVSRKTVVVNVTVVNQTVINRGPDPVVIEKASGRKIQAAPARELRTRDEAKAVARHPTPTPTLEKAVAAPVRNQSEKTLPAVAPRQIEKPAVTPAVPQLPVTKKELPQADEQRRIAKLDEEKRAQQEKASETERGKVKSAPAAAEAKPEPKRASKPDEKVESKPVAERPVATKEPAEQKAGKDDEKKD